MLRISSLSKNFGNIHAVDSLSFSLEEGTITGLLGPNGAGKSTTLKMITGALAPSRGEISVLGYDMIDDPIKAKHQIGYLPETPPLYPDLTVREYLDHICRLKGIRRLRTSEITRALEITDTTSMHNRLCRNLSKGFRQRVGTAAALLGDPPVIILDEPTAGLDPEQVLNLREALLKLKEDHIILISSHILSEIEILSDQMIILNQGKMAAFGTTKELIHSISTDRRVQILLKADIERITRLFSSDSSITVHSCEDGRESETTYCVCSSISGDVREQIFSLCAEQQIPILQMQPQTHSLEQIFLSMTEEEVLL